MVDTLETNGWEKVQTSKWQVSWEVIAENLKDPDLVEVMPWCVLYKDVLFGCPSDVLKVFMTRKISIPKAYVLPDSFYKQWVIQAAMEFPLYYFLFVEWWFFKWEKLKIIWTDSQIERIKKILNITLLWPTSQQYKEWWIDQSYVDTWLPMQTHFALKKNWTIAQVEDMVEFIAFEEYNNQVKIWDSSISKTRSLDVFEVKDIDWNISKVDLNFEGQQKCPVAIEKSQKIIESCSLWMTSLTKCTSWFDVSWWTTALVLWINWLPIWIDWTAWMKEHLHANWISSDELAWHILTHNHEDHSSIVDLILNWKKVNLITTKTIYECFVTKVSNYLDFPVNKVRKMISLQEVIPWIPFRWYWAEFTFWDTAHPIPTIWFNVKVDWANIVFSGDTAWWSQLQPLLENGVITKDHYDLLMSIPNMKSDLTYLDAGWWLIHPEPTDILEKARYQNSWLVLTHRSKLPEWIDYPLSKEWEHKIIIWSTQNNQIYSALLMNAPLIHWLSREWTTALLSRAKFKEYNAWETILEQWKPWKAFYMILKWVTSVVVDWKEVTKLTSWDYFGEMSLINNDICNASITTDSPCVIVEIPHDIFYDMITSKNADWNNQTILEKLIKVHQIRPFLLKFASFSKLPAQIIKNLCESLNIEIFSSWTNIIRKWDDADKLYWILEWEVDILVGDQIVAQLWEKNIFGEIWIMEWTKRTATVRAKWNVTVFSLTKSHLERIMDNSPILFYHLWMLSKERVKSSFERIAWSNI